MSDNAAAQKTSPVHIFDVDNTVVRKTSAGYFLRMALHDKYIRFSQVSALLVDWANYKFARPDNDFIENIVKNLSGLNKNDIEHVAKECFEKHIKPNIYTGAAKIIKETMEKGERVIFATSSFDFIIRPLEEYFGIEGSLSTRLEYSGGITTGKLAGYSFFGPKKKLAAQEWLDRNNIRSADVHFYSDSYTDIPLLEYCGNPVAVNPDRLLKQKAIKHVWKIMRFKEVLGN
ncbi:MAG: HAD-IB family hydrolase [Treponema sp.]|nr:HAD-IB family hydrolase [Treponema sp.]